MALLDRLRANQEDAYPQPQSPLFRLPIELRTQVYHLVYPENLLHLKENFRAVERNGLHCSAYWCIALNDYKKGYSHTPCDLFEATKKQMLGMPLTCRRLYLETIQLVYSRHTMHFFREEFALQWLRQIPKTHLDAITSVRLTGLFVDSPEYKRIWEMLSSLPNLQKLAVKISGLDVHDSWDCDMPNKLQDEISAPIKAVQQSTIQSFDVIVEIGSTWFPDDYYLRLDYNKLNWDTFSFDREQFLTLFDGIHPRCRVIGMNGFLFNRPVHDDMPNTAQLTNWISWFCCHAAYGAIYPPEYDVDEVGERFAAAAAAAATESADNEAGDGMRDPDLERIQEEREELERQYLDANAEDYNGDPETWDIQAINRVVKHIDRGPNDWPQLGRWHFPEKPSWIKDATLEEPYEFPEMQYGHVSSDEESRGMSDEGD